MARTAYNVGKASVEGNSIGNTKNAVLNMVGEDGDITAIGDTGGSLADISEIYDINITADYDAANAGHTMLRAKFIGGSRTLTSCAYYEDATKYFGGSGIITACSLTKSVGSFDQITATIRSCGAWSYT